MTQTMTEPVSREEWTERKQSAHPGLTALWEKGEQADAAERSQCDDLWAATAALLVERRKEFESALTDLLESQGAGWLIDYRACDSLFAGPHRMGTVHRSWFAFFDLRPVGFWPVRIELHNDTARHNWAPARSPFGVDLPAGTRWCATLAEAVRVASKYVECPF